MQGTGHVVGGDHGDDRCGDVAPVSSGLRGARGGEHADLGPADQQVECDGRAFVLTVGEVAYRGCGDVGVDAQPAGRESCTGAEIAPRVESKGRPAWTVQHCDDGYGDVAPVSDGLWGARGGGGAELGLADQRVEFDRGASVRKSKRSVDQLQCCCGDGVVVDASDACGSGDIGIRTKRLKQTQILVDPVGEDEDLLQFLDAGYTVEMEKSTSNKFVERYTDSDDDLVCEAQDVDIRAIAFVGMTTVKAKHNQCERKSGAQSDGMEDDVISDEGDLLKHLDVAYDNENCAPLDTSEVEGTSSNHVSVVDRNNANMSKDVNLREIAAVAMATTTYQRALADERAAYRRSRPTEADGKCCEADSLDYNSARGPTRTSDRDRARMYRDRKKSKNIASGRFGPVSDDDRAAALTRLQEALGPEGLDECACVACDELLLRRDATRKDASDWRFMNKMRLSLGEVDEKLPQALKDAYSAPAFISYLSNVMVAPNSFRCYTDEHGLPTAWFSICNACNKAIERGSMPRLAIANGFYLGTLPDKLTGLTLPERFMTQLVSISAMTRVMRGGRHRCIRSHCIAFDCTPGPPVSLLPRSISEVGELRVAIVGDFTEAQMEKVKKLHQIRIGKIRDVFDFYSHNNCLYSSVSRNESMMVGNIDLELLEHLIVEHIADEDSIVDESVRAELENIRGHSDAWQVTSERDELSVVERRIGLSDAAKGVLSRDAGCSEREQTEQKQRTFMLKRSNKISTDPSGDLLARMFPHLFPYGRGHPGECRQIPVSLKECIKHYTMLSSRNFAEDELFTLVSFDRISMMSMYTQNSIRCQRFPSIVSGFESIGSTELEKALLENEQRIQGQRSSRTEQESLAHKFLKTVEIASGAVWGSNAERAKCRQKAFGYQMRFGQPALFITLTPNTDNSLVMAHYAGVSSVSSLFDILDATMPTKAELREASLGNDCASTRLFMRNVDTFIQHVLAINPATQEKMPFRGLIGDVEAYFGMVETQGRGTLHIHMLVWLNGVPSCTMDLEAKLASPDGNDFKRCVELYAQSIVTNNLPLPIEKCTCVKCGATYSHLAGLAIPQRARQNPRRGIYNSKLHASIVEPALVQCEICKAKFSAQHVLRNVLLKNRPMHWPPWAHQLTKAETDDSASKEVVARDTFRQAVHVISEREMTQMQVRSDCEVLTERYGLVATPETDELQAANLLQMPTCSSDDDPFQNDELTRLIEALPPMLADGRMDRNSMDYMVSVLVVLLNQHWWTHTSSCFKTSKRTVNDSFCRYLFPRNTVSKTTFDLAGVHLERKVAHEFVNGYNYEIMATFKCNHDIQILLGGRDVGDRIHYCTKYVTKQQKQLDSVVVMALASFQRRQERERQEACDGQSQTTEWLAKARKRVASMVYTMTSRQEVAGPLAALYLYRGSCCYESSRCSFVPLSDIVRQLCSSEEYSCSLVDESSEKEAARFQAVSFLDDYVYRPDMLELVNIYEFAMVYYRKKDARALTGKLPFKKAHPLHHSYSLAKRYKEAVPVIQGFRIPFVTDNSPTAIRYKHAILSLVLFKPFRALADLINSTDSCEDQWLDSYGRWEGTRSSFVIKIMNHIDDYHNGEDRANAATYETATAVAGTLTVPRYPCDSDDDSDDSLFSCYDFDDDTDAEAVDTDGDFVNPWDLQQEESSIILDIQTLDPRKFPISAMPDRRVAQILQVFRTHNLLQDSATRAVAQPQSASDQLRFPTVQDMRNWVQDTSTDNRLLDELPCTLAAHETELVELLNGALEDVAMSWWNSGSLPQPKPCERESKFANIRQISQDYTLNEKQHHAFRLIGKALLTRWRKVEDLSYVNSNLGSALRQDQLRFFLGGEGGTGKSRVLDAVQALCKSWNRADCIIKTALTGKAATLICGRTLASFMLQLKIEEEGASDLFRYFGD